MSTFASGSGQGNINLTSGQSGSPALIVLTINGVQPAGPQDFGNFAGAGGTTEPFTLQALARGVSSTTPPSFVFEFTAAGSSQDSRIKIDSVTVIEDSTATSPGTFQVEAFGTITYPAAGETDAGFVWTDSSSGNSTFLAVISVEGT